jgi:hypothetical protein
MPDISRLPQATEYQKRPAQRGGFKSVQSTSHSACGRSMGPKKKKPLKPVFHAIVVNLLAIRA